MKKILITRKLIKSSENYASKVFEAKFNENDQLLTKEQIIKESENCDGILSSITEKFDSDTISKLPKTIKIISNFAVGFGNIDKINPEFIATGNIGCITQIANGTKIPILHTVEVIDWYTGGPKPKILRYL